MKKNEKNLKIAMIGHKAIPSRCGGIEQVLTILCPLLVEKGHKVLCINRSGCILENEYTESVFNNTYRGVQLKYVITLHKKGLAALTSSFFASVYLAFHSYDIIHYHAEGPCAMMWIPKLFHKRCIATVHGLDWQRDKWKNGLGSKYIKFGEKMLIKYADEIIVLSRNTQKYFKETYGRDTHFIPNGVSKPKIKTANEIIKRFNLHKDEYFCSISRLTKEKGIHYLIEAYKKIITNKKLVIVGDSSDTDDYVRYLKDKANENPNIIFTGFVSGSLLDEMYSNAYAYIIPSNLEGMPLSLLEAMSYGNAVIGSDIAEITEVVEDKALIFQKGNVNDLASKLQRLNDNPSLVKKMKEESSEFICKKYNWDDIADKTLRLYQSEHQA